MRKNHISVCICTFKRAALLRLLLDHLETQKTDGRFTFSAVVADNDSEGSARAVVDSFRRGAKTEVVYCLQPVPKNIAMTRNVAVANADGEFIAFIDDDEYPEDNWLVNLFNTCVTTESVAGVLGPVRPYFESEPPKWASKGRFFERAEFPTGYKLNFDQARSGNVLFRAEILKSLEIPFREHFNTAGEDVDFFRRLMANGYTFVWCNEAVALEIVPASRCTRRYLLRRALLRGSNFSKHPTQRIKNGLKSLIAAPCYAISLPVLLLFGQHVFLKYLIKFLDHFSRLMSYAGVPLVKEQHT